MLNVQTTYDAARKAWIGAQIPRTYKKEPSLGKSLLEALLKKPTHIGQICYPSGNAYTNEELATLSISVANHLTELGLKQCDIVGICASNSDFLAPLVFGAMFKGIAISTLDVTYEKEGIKHTFGITKPKMMFCDGGNYKKVKEALKEIGLNIQIYTMKAHIENVPSIKEFLNETPTTLEFNFEPLKMGLIQTAAILCSSGTTGMPKGVTFSNEDLLELDFSKMPADEKYLCFSPIHWVTGLWALLGGTFSALIRIISDRPFLTDDFFDISTKYQPTLLFTSPSQLAMILAAPKVKITDLSSIKLYVIGGSAVPYAVAKQLKEYMPKAIFLNGYGMSEIRGIIATGVLTEKKGLVGMLNSNIQVKIVGDDGRRLGPNEVGEFFVRTPYKWLGYYDNEKTTAAACDAEGWIISGDMGYIDEQGLLYLVDRKKDILKYNSFQYIPTEIEQVIYELDDVLEVCVCGLTDSVSSDLPTAAVIKKAGSDLKERDIYEHVAQRLEHFKQLRGGVYFFEKMPHTVTGKIVRSEVKKLCEKLRNEGVSEEDVKF